MKDGAVSWDQVLQQRTFWFDYFELCFDEPAAKKHFGRRYDMDAIQEMGDLLEGSSLVIRFPRRYRLRIEFFGTGAGHHLFLEGPSGPPLELGWVDSSFYPDAFRWPEYEVLAGWLERNGGGGLPGRTAPLLLLNYVSKATAGEWTKWGEHFRDGLVATGSFSVKDARFLARLAAPEDGRTLDWREDPEKGWVPVFDDYALRSEVYGPFDHKRLRKFLAVVASE